MTGRSSPSLKIKRHPSHSISLALAVIEDVLQGAYAGCRVTFRFPKLRVRLGSY